MGFIKLDGLAVLHQAMRKKKLDRCTFPFARNQARFHVFFSTDTNPYRLAFGLAGGKWSFSIAVERGYLVADNLPPDDYAGLRRALSLQGLTGPKFRPIDFFSDFNASVPNQPSQIHRIQPQVIAPYRSVAEEADKVYFVRWIPHAERHVSANNLDKTRQLLGEEAFRFCRDKNVSMAWTDDPERATKAWLHLPTTGNM